MSDVVALVSSRPVVELGRYLEDLGFDVVFVRLPARARRTGTLVWLAERDVDERVLVDAVGSWLGALPKLRAIVVTEHPARLRGTFAQRATRVRVLAAPVFGWQLVDALRGGDLG